MGNRWGMDYCSECGKSITEFDNGLCDRCYEKLNPQDYLGLNMGYEDEN